MTDAQILCKKILLTKGSAVSVQMAVRSMGSRISAFNVSQAMDQLAGDRSWGELEFVGKVVNLERRKKVMVIHFW